MNTGLIIRLGITALLVVLVCLFWTWIENEIAKLIYVIIVGAIVAIFGAKYLIPWIGDVMGTFIYSSGEEIQQDERMKASAKLAQGDFEGAIGEYEKLLKSKPEDTFAIAEAAKVYSQRLDEPDKALAFIQRHLSGREWPEDEAAFLMFRLVDIHLDPKKDYDKAREVLNEVIARYPNTRHSANAYHRITEIEQAQYKEIIAARQKAGGQA